MYNQSPEKIKSILDVWKIIEILTPTKNEKLARYYQDIAKHRDENKKFCKKIDDKETLFLLKDAPFEKFEKANLDIQLKEDEEASVHWHVYLGYLKWSDAELDILKKVKNLSEVNGEVLKNYKNQENVTITPIAGFIIDENKYYVPESMVISTAAYALGIITNDNFCEDDFMKLVNFERFSENLINNALNYKQDESEEKDIFNLERINLIADFLIEELNIDGKYLIDRSEICVRRITTKKKKNRLKPSSPSLEMFNSFFLSPLNLVRNVKASNFTKNSAIAKYLGQADKPQSKDILQNPSLQQDLLSPLFTPCARWPSSPQNPLALMQTTAINSILANLMFWHTEHSRGNLFAVNGPPGTGKTTMLFDIIANVYVERAVVLTSFENPNDGFVGEEFKYIVPGSTYSIKALHPSLQHYGIILASSNNNAVKNISEELPLYAKIAPQYRDKLNYFNQFLGDKDSWGIFAAVLGNKSNCTKFINKFWNYRSKKDNDNANYYTMRQYLNLLVGKGNDLAPESYKPEYCDSQESINLKWKNTCQEFNDLHGEIFWYHRNMDTLTHLITDLKELLARYKSDDLEAILEEKEEKYDYLTVSLDYLNSKTEELNYEIECLTLDSYNIVQKFLRTEKYRSFKRKNLELISLKKKNKKEIKELKLDIINIKAQIKQIKTDIESLDFYDCNIEDIITKLKSKGFDTAIFEKDSFWDELWRDYDNNYQEFHKSNPYFNVELEELRSKLFIKAVELHEVFINANANNFWNSLNVFARIITSPSTAIEYKTWHAVWQNFFMVVPIVSTTFHSLDRMFMYAKHEDLSWLIIDEAGQAPPQYAASAIYKSKNVIVVGDQMQTEPISILKEDLIKILCNKFDVSFSDWSPSNVSVQHLADRNSLYQTKINNNMVGFPLLVHRRCQNPMFDICNKIAYDNKMVFAAFASNSYLKKILGNSRWIDVQEKTTERYKYESEEEFKALLQLINEVLKEQNSAGLLSQIYVITIYKDCSVYIRKRLNAIYNKSGLQKVIKEFCNNNVGTIHSFQGKEADTVIMLLGAQHPSDIGARNIMTNKPNVLNVGISRAKNNLYIIGNKSIWMEHNYMPDIYAMISSN